MQLQKYTLNDPSKFKIVVLTLFFREKSGQNLSGIKNACLNPSRRLSPADSLWVVRYPGGLAIWAGECLPQEGAEVQTGERAKEKSFR